MWFNLLKYGILIGATLIIFENWIGPQRYTPSNPLSLTQAPFQFTPNLLNQDGTVTGEGWQINAPFVSSNQA